MAGWAVEIICTSCEEKAKVTELENDCSSVTCPNCNETDVISNVRISVVSDRVKTLQSDYPRGVTVELGISSTDTRPPKFNVVYRRRH